MATWILLFTSISLGLYPNQIPTIQLFIRSARVRDEQTKYFEYEKAVYFVSLHFPLSDLDLYPVAATLPML